ncbi:MAG: hydrogenase maturation nickel metallochaperone HypA [Thiohalomonadaceae bacterium]
MHELSLCQGLIRQVLEIAREHRAERVEQVVLRVGPLSGVEPNLLADAFPFATAGTRAEGAELIIETDAVHVRCLSCGAETEASPNSLACADCGDLRTELLNGDELLLVSVQLSGMPQLATHH